MKQLVVLLMESKDIHSFMAFSDPPTKNRIQKLYYLTSFARMFIAFPMEKIITLGSLKIGPLFKG
jgi:hypothetical protein